jgi:predicted RNase H-like HicB family nuclease
VAVFVEVQGNFSSYIEELPGVNSQGETLIEAKENLEDTLQLILETNKILSQKKHSLSALPRITKREELLRSSVF